MANIKCHLNLCRVTHQHGSRWRNISQCIYLWEASDTLLYFSAGFFISLRTIRLQGCVIVDQIQSNCVTSQVRKRTPSGDRLVNVWQYRWETRDLWKHCCASLGMEDGSVSNTSRTHRRGTLNGRVALLRFSNASSAAGGALWCDYPQREGRFVYAVMKCCKITFIDLQEEIKILLSR